MILWVFTCIFVFFPRYVAPFNHVSCCYTLYNIIWKICIQNPSVLYVISHKNCRFRPFSPVFARFQPFLWNTGPNRSEPVQAGCGCRLPIFRPKNRTGPDLRTLYVIYYLMSFWNQSFLIWFTTNFHLPSFLFAVPLWLSCDCHASKANHDVNPGPILKMAPCWRHNRLLVTGSLRS